MIDVTIFRALNSLAGHGVGWDQLIVFFGSYAQYPIGLALVILSLWPVRRYRMFVAAFGAAIVARLAVKELIILFVHRARPFVELANVRNLIGTDISENFQSFPSGHAVFFFALAMGVYLYDKRSGFWFFVAATLMGIARVAGGIHWPSDIVGGALIGMLTAWLMVRLIPALRPRQTPPIGV